MRKLVTICIIGLMTIAVSSCKDPRDKTVWDYIGHQNANPDEWKHGIEDLHEDLIKHGYMEPHDCDEMRCADNHKNTYDDINRINMLLGGGDNTEPDFIIGYDSVP